MIDNSRSRVATRAGRPSSHDATPAANAFLLTVSGTATRGTDQGHSGGSGEVGRCRQRNTAARRAARAGDGGRGRPRDGVQASPADAP
jgi:hypothetical protein